MAIDCAVRFEGRRWPGAHVVGRIKQGFSLTASGTGQQWTANRPLAFWRSFSALDLSGTQLQVINFLKRHGDPTGQLDRCRWAGGPLVSDMAEWGPLIEELRQVAAAWDKADARGVSSLSADAHRLRIAGRALQRLLPADPDAENKEISKEIEVHYAIADGITLWPGTLRAFMVMSAAYAREQAIDMRKCAYCEDWFELRRSDAVYCSPSCQATDHKRRAARS